MGKQVFVIGAGGHAKVIAEILQLQHYELRGFFDDDKSLHDQKILKQPIVGSIDILQNIEFDGLIIGIGDNRTRYRIFQELTSIDHSLWITVSHPSAIISPHTVIGLGTVCIANSVINIDSKIGDHCIINTAATVDHDCVVGNYSHICPGAHLAGGVMIGEGAFVGTGANILPRCTVGEWAVVGAGATVIEDVPSYSTVAGTPAKIIKKR